MTDEQQAKQGKAFFIPRRPSRARSNRRPKGLSRVLTAAVLLGAAALTSETVMAAPEGDSPRISEVGHLPVSGDNEHLAGWLILNPRTRRAYQIFEGSFTTTLRSFDLDTLKPLKHVAFVGWPLLGGWGIGNSGSGFSWYSGEVLHAVDEERGLLYLPLSNISPSSDPAAVALHNANQGSGNPDGARPLSRMVVIDEAQLDAGGPAFASFLPPATHPMAKTHLLQGMDVTRHHVEAGKRARLALLFGQPGPSLGAYPSHSLVMWDTNGVQTWSTNPNPPVTAQLPTDAPRGWESPPLIAQQCGKAPLTGTYDSLSGLYSWGLLPTKSAVYFVCQAGDRSGQVVRLAVDQRTGEPLPAETPRTFPLSRPVGDVLVDRAGGRLLLRANSPANGWSWWLFDTAVDRYTGAMAGSVNGGLQVSYGIDQGTGRFYSLMPDHSVAGGGKTVAVRGGLFISDIRVDPLPAPTNVVPSLAYPASKRIVVDPVTQRVFVRRGHASVSTRAEYPDIDITKHPAPVESFYRVLTDGILPSEKQKPSDDSAFTTNVAEAKDVTQSSYYATASGYGSRILLIGGWGAVGPLCGGDRNDREVVAGGVRQAVLSDLSTEAAAAGLTADAATREDLAHPLKRCAATVEPTTGDRGGYSFTPEDFAAACVGDGSPSTSRHGYDASATCDGDTPKVTARAKGALVSGPFVAAYSGLSTGALPVKVGWSDSQVKLERDPANGGVRVTVTSVARNVEIPLNDSVSLRIGVVRTEATSWAAGRKGKAKATFVRTVCAVDFPGSDIPNNGSCRSSDTESGQRDLQELEKQVKDRFGGQMEIHFKLPDPTFLTGSTSGYQAAVQRDRLDRFQDRSITRDDSLAIPGMEVMFFRGDSPGDGAGRQILQLAGAQASTSYGITCLWGQGPDGACLKGADGFGDLDGDLGGDLDQAYGGDDLIQQAFDAAFGGIASTQSASEGSGLSRVLHRLLQIPVQLARLLLSSPREFGLMAAVWALLYTPCYLSERRKTLGRLAGAVLAGAP